VDEVGVITDQNTETMYQQYVGLDLQPGQAQQQVQRQGGFQMEE